MFFISKTVADGIRRLAQREDVARELEAIRAMPGFEVYANAIAEGLGDGRKGANPGANPGAKPRRDEPRDDDEA